MVKNKIQEDTDAQKLRFLYRNAKGMLQSDDVQTLCNTLVDGLVELTGFERVVVLRLNHDNTILESQSFYGFLNGVEKNYRLPMEQVNGLLRKVYTDREPLAVLEFPDIASSTGTAAGKCAILREASQSDAQQNRRTKINLCQPCEMTGRGNFCGNDRFKHYSFIDMDVRDKTVSALLGDSRSFLILPICDNENFHGYVLVDNALSDTAISYDNMRYASAIVQHSAQALKRSKKTRKMLDRIAVQMDEINRMESFYHSIVRQLHFGLLILDRNMDIIEANRAAEQMLGHDNNDLPGHSISSFFADQQQTDQYTYHEIVKNIDSNSGILSEILMQKKNGETFPSEACFSIITDNDATISGLICTFRDLTNRQVLEQDLARADKLASLGELATGVAHEIKNPLAGIAGALQILARDFQEESRYQYVFNEVQAQVKRIDSFVNNLLRFARPGETKFIDIDLEKIINRTLSLATSQNKKKNIRIILNFNDKQHHVMGDEGQLQQVFLNIILNAFESMDDGGELAITSRCELFPEQKLTQKKSMTPVSNPPIGTINISFKDSGEGMEPHELESIFNPLHTTKSSGTGLGLPITSRIIEQHGGAIVVESEPGTGSTFTVQLPLCRK